MARSNEDGATTAESYIGSLISLISKSEIRYEGLLFDINTSESSIRLRNVKSFGTEGRKKDGPQVPPSDKVYEYILFRGNDIKDLQVKASQPVESTSSLFNDPAIIQSHYSHGAATSTSSQTLQAELPQSALQPNPISGSWGFTSIPPITNSSSFPMPMYMQGFYGASEGILQSPLGLSIPSSMQQYPIRPSLLPPIGTGTLNSNLMSPAQSSSLPLASPSDSVLDRSTFSTSIPDKLENVSGLSMPYDTGFKPLSSDSGASGSLLNRGSAPLLVTPNQLLQPGPASSGLLRLGPTANQVLQPGPMQNQDLQLGNTATQVLQPRPTPPQIFQPGSNSNQLLQTGITTTSALNYSSDSAQKDVKVVQIPSTERTLATQNKIQAPLLPLPSRHDYKVNGNHSYAHYISRGPRDRLRGHGGSRHVSRFTEEFDFTAMNEKFKKDEIWGDLGKSNTTIEEQGSSDKDHAGKSIIELKPVYVKDDFFDSLSCYVSDRGRSKNGRANFSEQRKLDVETFGNYARNRGGHGQSHGGRGYVHGGQGYSCGGRGYVISNSHGYGGNMAPLGYVISNSHGYSGKNASRGYGGRGHNGNGSTSSGHNQRSYRHHAT